MKILLRLRPYLRPFLPLILTSAVLAIPLAALRSGVAPFVKYFIDDLQSPGGRDRLWFYPAVFVGIFVVNFAIRFPHYYLLRIVVVRVNQRIKNDLFQHLMGLSADYFTAQSTGTLISRVGSDPQYIDGGLSCLNTLVREPLTFAFLFGYALWLDWQLTLIMLLILPALAWVFTTTGRNLKRYIARITDENAGLFSTLQESFTGVRVIKTFRLEEYVQSKFRARSDAFTTLLLKTSAMEEAAHPLVELLTAFAIAGVLYFGGVRVLDGRMTPGGLIAFCATFALLMNPLRLMNDVNIKLAGAASACQRIFAVFDWRSNLEERPAAARLTGFDREIAFEDVSFAYPDARERAVLRGVSFRVERGGSLALVGASGAGKSSLVSLLPRIFDVTGGAIRIDGQDIRDVSLDDLRKLISVVSQDVFLFNDTIEENIRCGKLGASTDEIHAAARQAFAADFIESLPDGYATRIGDRGQKLSGGERQRLSIARAFLRDAPILILDEATSSLDSTSERAVQAALEGLMKHKTTILIAHRLSTVRDADHILVLKDGSIVESGKHDELMRLGGQYAGFHVAVP